MAIYRAGSRGKLYKGAAKVRKVYQGNKRVYSSGNICTYHVDTGIAYQEEVEEGASCLTPKTFTPAKAGWEFVGWWRDMVASGNVLGSLAMGDNPVGLYAVFRQAVTLSYSGNGGTGTVAAQTGTRYYNNGNVANPSFTVKANGFTRQSHIFYRWAKGSATGDLYAPGAAVILDADTTFHAYWIASVQGTFGYTGRLESFTVLFSGLYKLEVWGAQGGYSEPAKGGLGGYSCGYIILQKGTTLTINVGINSNHTAGKQRNYTENDVIGIQTIGAGGALTSILKNTGVILIAGGGGGATSGYTNRQEVFSYVGGSGGGLAGGSGTGGPYTRTVSTGGTQGGNGTDATLLYGSNPSYGGAGGGYYRGGQGILGSDRPYATVSGGGGSGYTGGIPAITYRGKTYSPSMSGGVNSGNGSAKITIIEEGLQ